MLDYSHLLGRSYVPGKTDCLGIARDFFNPHLPKPIKNYARPTDFATESVDLFSRHFYEAGFRVLDVHPSQWRLGDVALIALFSSFASHCAILTHDGKILHHMLGQLSTEESYSSQLRNRTLGVLRHQDFDPKIEESVADMSPYLPAAVLEKFANG